MIPRSSCRDPEKKNGRVRDSRKRDKLNLEVSIKLNRIQGKNGKGLIELGNAMIIGMIRIWI